MTAWKEVWSAGHGVGDVNAVQGVSEIVDRFARDCEESFRRQLALHAQTSVAAA